MILSTSVLFHTVNYVSVVDGKWWSNGDIMLSHKKSSSLIVFLTSTVRLTIITKEGSIFGRVYLFAVSD